VVVVGGGAAGVLAGVALMRHSASVEVRIVEREPIVGPGLAYGAAEPHHLLNNTVHRMSAVHGDTSHLLRWCREQDIRVTPGSFVPRRTYGRYLADVAQGLASSSAGRLIRVRGEAVRVREHVGAAVVQLACGWELSGDVVVLALGNPPPSPQPLAGVTLSGPRWVPDPWASGALDTVVPDDRVLLLGTGLTMIDVATSLAARHSQLRMVATSRHAMLPQPHSRAPFSVGEGVRPEAPGLSALVRAVGRQLRAARANGHDWRGVVDGVRPQLGDLWETLSFEDRERFLRHVARRWEVHRHRMAPEVADQVSQLRQTRRLEVRSGSPDLSVWTRIINCTGPQSTATPGWSPLVDGLLRDGAACSDPLGLGFLLDGAGALIDATGRASDRLYVLGAGRRGARWEAAAVPEIRDHAAQLAERLTGIAVNGGLSAGAPTLSEGAAAGA
jgi:uncharacterized NAD(P)/FAD-binding protein YdhS